MKRFFLFSCILAIFCLMLSCKSNPTTPTPIPTIMSVAVTSSHSIILVGQTEQMTATVTMSDGTTKAGVGTWSSDAPSRATIDTSGLVKAISAGGVNIIFNNTAGGQGSKGLTVRNTWSMSGAGDNVFDMPTYVQRVKITATYTHYSSNFIVYIAGKLIVNELLGTGWDQTHFEGTYVTSGGTVEIKYSSGVAWTFTEVPVTTATTNTIRKIPNFTSQFVSGNREYEIYKRISKKTK